MRGMRGLSRGNGTRNRPLKEKKREYSVPMIKIQRNVPLPSDFDLNRITARAPKSPPLPLAGMQVGDSIVVEGRTITRIGTIVAENRKRTGRRYTCRTIG